VSAISGLSSSGIKDMKKFKLALCLVTGLAFSPIAFAHEAPLPHEHGTIGATLLLGALLAVSALATTVYWTALKRDDE